MRLGRRSSIKRSAWPPSLAVIVSFLPLYFITGMMGPYMRPMALNVPVTMIMSMIVAFTITPWLAYHLLKRHYGRTSVIANIRRSVAVATIQCSPLSTRKTEKSAG